MVNNLSLLRAIVIKLGDLEALEKTEDGTANGVTETKVKVTVTKIEKKVFGQ